MPRWFCRLPIVLVAMVCAGNAAVAPLAQTPARDTLPGGPLVFDSSTRGPSGNPIPGPRFRVVAARGLARPYGLAFLPDGRMLVTERARRLLIVQHGVVDPVPVEGVPPVLDRNLKGLNDLALHPRFAENGWIYFTYYKPEPDSTEGPRAVLARGRYDGGHALTGVRDLFATSTVVTGPSERPPAVRTGRIDLSGDRDSHSGHTAA
jgi:glucose/arabinose dehydrogenase